MHTKAEVAAKRTEFGQVTVYPILGYRDLAAAIDWLIRVFSFEPLAVYKNSQGEFVHVELRLGDGVVMPTRLDKSGDPNNPWSQPMTSQGIYVAIDRVDTHYRRAVSEGAEILRSIGETPYGGLEYTARDLKGILELRHLPATARLTGLDLGLTTKPLGPLRGETRTSASASKPGCGRNPGQHDACGGQRLPERYLC